MLNTLLVDAGPLAALFDKDDKYHKKIVAFIKGKSFQFVTTTAVITEVTHLLDFRVETQLLFFQWVLHQGVVLHEITVSDIPRILELTQKYRDCPMDFADATLVRVAEKTGIKKIMSLDSDFYIYRLPGKVRIENVLA